jgi:ATP-dependent RNA helicase RhlE
MNSKKRCIAFTNNAFFVGFHPKDKKQGEIMTFQALNLIEPILKAVAFEGYLEPSPIQEQAIPVLLEGKDLLASAQTGTGKTAAFAIPIIQALYHDGIEKGYNKHIKALILAPTRELAEQIKESFRTYSRGLGLKTEVIYGGVSQRNQEKALNQGVDVLIATPGRLLDLMGQGIIHLDMVKFFVLDEADRMLDMGFVHDVRRIMVTVPKIRQTMLFSATIPNEILKLANELLTNPIRIEVTPPDQMIDKIKQSLFYVSKKDKTNLLIDLLVNPEMKSVLIFTRTKHGANKLVKELLAYGVKADAIHGNKSQNNRQKALSDFKSGKLRVLVATDIAARGIDIDELSHVINYDLPETPETYVHRMGRTGRAGLSGEAYSFCSQDENHLLKSVEKHIKMSIPVNENHAFHVKIRLEISPSDVPVKKTSRGTLKNKTKDASMKKNFGSKQKKSYHELVEELETEKQVFKRSELPKKKPVLILEDVDKPAKEFKPSSKKGYLPHDPDRNEKEFRPRNTYDNKKPYTPRPQGDSSGSKPYSRSTSSDSSKPYTPKPSYGSSPSKPYTPKPQSGQQGSNNGPRPKYQNQIRKPNKV